jgi:hypothetical protein
MSIRSTSHFYFVDGRPVDVLVQESSPYSYYASSSSVLMQALVTGPDDDGNLFSAPLEFRPSPSIYPISYVLGADWVSMAHVNALCECNSFVFLAAEYSVSGESCRTPGSWV